MIILYTNYKNIEKHNMITLGKITEQIVFNIILSD